MRTRRHYEAIFQKALAYMRSHLSEKLTVPQVANGINCSYDQLKRAFRTTTDEGPLQYLLRLRADKARHLLRQTDLSVTEIAFEVGFNSYTQFASIFQSRTGTSAREFRKSIERTGLPEGSPELSRMKGTARQWFSDSFNGPAIGSCWAPQEGEWVQNDGYLQGTGIMRYGLKFKDPLPENFRISFNCMFTPRDKRGPSDLAFGLGSQRKATWYCGITLGAHDSNMGVFRCRGSIHDLNPSAIIQQGYWYQVSVELNDDMVRTTLAGKEVFLFKDAFPPSYADRCQFSFSGWCSTAKFRDFIIQDLGFLPVVRTIRQGDSLYNADLYEKAREFYQRILQSEVSSLNTMELRYKIGMCFLREGATIQARAWLGKVVALPENEESPETGNNLWEHMAGIADLEVDCEQEEFDVFCEKARALFPVQSLHGRIRELMQSLIARCQKQGFYNRRKIIQELRLEMEIDDTFLSILTRLELASTLIGLREWKASERHLRKVTQFPGLAEGLLFRAHYVLADSYQWQGRVAEAEEIIKDLRLKTENRFQLSQCDILQAALLRAGEKFDEAISLLKQAAVHYHELKNRGWWALLNAFEILCGQGQTRQATELLEQSAKAYSPKGALAGPNKSRFLFVPFFLEGNHEKAAEILLADAWIDDRNAAMHAEQAVKAGILLELAGKDDEAVNTWSKTIRRFPASHCCYYASLAECFRSGKQDNLEAMPYETRLRSEMFYMAAALYKKRGNTKRTTELLKRSWKEDPSLRWPSYLAKQSLLKKGPNK